MERLKKVFCAEVVQVIKLLGEAGDGVEENPVHMAVQYWTPDGKLIATMDYSEDRRKRQGEEYGHAKF